MDIDESAVGNRSQQDVTRTTADESGHDPQEGCARGSIAAER